MHGIAEARTVGEMSSGQLECAANDLRNSGLVVKHAGHFRHALVSRDDGSVCALSAIQLATYKRLTKIPVTNEFITLTQMEHWRASTRAHHAVMAFAKTLPSDLCESCPTPTDFADVEASRVTHFNDNHCEDGDLLVTLFNNAADRAMTEAAERRSLLHGRLLAGV